MLVLAIESSTSAAKALLYDPDKGIVDSLGYPYGSDISANGKTDMRAVYELTMSTAKKIIRGKKIDAIGLCGTWHGMGVCDFHMNPVTPVFSWNFTETAADCDKIRKNEYLTDDFYRRTGCMPHNTYPRHVISWLKDRGFSLKDKKIITQGGYNFYMLTGEFMESCCTMSGNGVINMDEIDYDEWVLDYFGVKYEQFGKLASWTDVRPLSLKGAAALGIEKGIPVVPAHADGALNQIGNYAQRAGVMTMSVGTSAAIRVKTNKPVLPKNRELWCYRGVNSWISGAATAGACNCINWFVKDVMGEAKTYQELEDITAKSAKVPVFLPFLFGERCPGWNGNRMSGFFHIDSSMGYKELYLAVQMGILFNIYQCYEVLRSVNKEPEEIILSGGICNSLKWTQMAADIFKKDLRVADFPNASCMGAAALALNSIGVLDDINDFRADYNKSRIVVSDPKKAAYYERQYERYLELYDRA